MCAICPFISGPPIFDLRTLPNESESTVLESMKSSCGRRPSNGIGFAMSGKEPIMAPWAVSLGRWSDDVFEHECTGSLLAPSMVLTAAHCITTKHFDRETFRVCVKS